MTLEIILKDRTYIKATATALVFDTKRFLAPGSEARLVVNLYNGTEHTATVFGDRIERINLEADYNGPG